ncbi:glycosyltransferase family 2 protein [Aeromonas veronii]|uniref:glycosyltransferase family 2 protein n=1 Tax=Aeromonas veronii TaxID=654 RepID=UPI00226CC43C|nr:glycosyltransferase family A protein [Aeromonas veronii]MCX9103487.1 glycosyltransferase family 2 protein [Aeromonas veronii]MCX9119138.1 glycosyltransferase family 2 protein [Aeromonas veronii]
MQNRKNQLVTIVIPCYQQGHLLSRALISVQRQTYDAIEVIVVDDGSEPAIDIEEKEYSFPLVILRQKNQGLSAARNAGLKSANGSYIKFLDADDELLPECIANQVAMMASENTIGCIGFREINESTGKENDIIPAFGDALSALLMVNIGPPHIYLFRTNEVRACGGFSQDSRVDGGHEDYDLILRRVIQGANLLTHHSVGVIYYRREGSMSTVRERMDKTRAAVWSYNVNEYLTHSFKLTDLNVVLIALCNMLRITMQEYRPNLCSVIIKLENIVNNNKIDMDSVSHNFIVEHLCGFPETSILAALISNKKVLSTDNLILHPQAVIDHRVTLMQAFNGFSDKYIIDVINMATKHNDKLAIYGAGEIGNRLVRIISAAGFKPVAIYDKNWRTISSIDSIVVSDPDTIDGNVCTGIVIASFSYRSEIRKYIEERSNSIELL